MAPEGSAPQCLFPELWTSCSSAAVPTVRSSRAPYRRTTPTVPAAPTITAGSGLQERQVSWVLNAPADAGCPVTSSIVTCSGTGPATRAATVAGDLTSAFVGSLEMPDASSSKFYRFFFAFANRIAANYSRASASNKPEVAGG